MYKVDLTSYNKIDYYYENNNIIQKLLIFLYKNVPIPNFIKVIFFRIKTSGLSINILILIRYFLVKTKLYLICNYIKNMIRPVETSKKIELGGCKLTKLSDFSNNNPEFLDMIILPQGQYNLSIEYPIRRSVEYGLYYDDNCKLQDLLSNIVTIYENIYHQDNETQSEFTYECIRKCTNCNKHINIKAYNDFTLNNTYCSISKEIIEDNICVRIHDKLYNQKWFVDDTIDIHKLSNIKCKLCNQVYNFDKSVFRKMLQKKNMGFERYNQTNGKYGIWGFNIDELILKEIIIDKSTEPPKILLMF
jgi:hypothetical protein